MSEVLEAATPDPVRYGFQVGGQFPDGMPSGPELLAVAQAAENAGFDSVWAGEHLSFHNPIHDAFVTLAYLAAGTQSVRLGTGIVLVPLRQPVWLAKTAASLDHLSSGRLVLGVGVGGEGEKDFAAAGVPVAGRGRRTDEYLDVIKKLWSADDVVHDGAHISFEGVTIEPKPLQPGGPPLWIGGKSHRAVDRAVDQQAGWLPAYVSPRQYAEAIDRMRARCQQTGTPLPPLGLYMHTLVGADDAKVRQSARDHFSERYQQATPDHILDRLCLVGEPDRIRERIAEYRALGVTDVVFIPMAPWQEHIEQIEFLAQYVLGEKESES